jgi:translation initiation factor 2B subunit (eIF-2B alpha/beta/delta family)
MTSDDPTDEEKTLLKRLRPEADTVELLQALSDIGISQAALRRAVSVSTEALRLWGKGGTVRPSNRRIVEDIANAASTLLQGPDDHADVVRWLTKPKDWLPEAPLELLRDQPGAVLAAAEAHIAGRADEEQQLLTQALDGIQRSEHMSLGGDIAESSDWSSTQLKRLLLARLQELTANHTSASEAKRNVEIYLEPEVERLPNYLAYKVLLDQVREALDAAGDAPAEIAISEVLATASADENNLREKLAHLAPRLIDPSVSRILTYSMSMRVIQTLWGLPKERQAECALYVAEARVKSIPKSGGLPPFADAAEILRFLRSTAYDIFVVPDAIASTLVARNRVDLVLLGAQKIFVDEHDEPTHFVATAGTEAILRAARDTGVRVSVLAEEDKISTATPDVDTRERTAPLNLPSNGTEEGRDYARLMMISAELCNIKRDDEGAVGDPSIVRRVTREKAGEKEVLA